MGATSLKDGTSCLSFPANLSNVSVELIESQNPVLIEKKELICDSAGPGKFRGGLGQEVSTVILPGDNAPDGVLRVGVRGGRFEHPVPGILGGGDAPPSEVIFNGTRIETGTGFPMKPGDRLIFRSAGGGGYGDPFEREPSAVEQDVFNGLVSAEASRTKYGVVLNANRGTVDLNATEKLRRELTK